MISRSLVSAAVPVLVTLTRGWKESEIPRPWSSSGDVPPEGFSYVVRDDGEVQISHHRRAATVLRGAAAQRFLVDVQNRDPQELMARLTGNYKRGNQRTGKNHPRNRGL